MRCKIDENSRNRIFFPFLICVSQLFSDVWALNLWECRFWVLSFDRTFFSHFQQLPTAIESTSQWGENHLETNKNLDFIDRNERWNCSTMSRYPQRDYFGSFMVENIVLSQRKYVNLRESVKNVHRAAVSRRRKCQWSRQKKKEYLETGKTELPWMWK